ETGKILMAEALEGALVIPQKATFEVLDKRFVFVVDEHNKVASRRIEVAFELPHLFVIKAGLSENDRLLLEGLLKVHEGSLIDVEYQEPASVLASLELPAE